MNLNLAENVDDAIRLFEDDLLKRSPFVDRLAAILRAAPKSSSNVFALYGEWGSGKTSVKNLLLNRLAEKPDLEGTPQVVEFNPWAFSTQGELMHAFFDETSRAIGAAAPEVAMGLARLGAYLSIGSASAKATQLALDAALIPGGGWVGLFADAAKAVGEKAKQYGADLKEGKVESLEVVRKELSEALAKFERPVLVIIDDLDRLPAEQIVQMFQLVRINASLPRINFLLLMDPKSVMKALNSKQYPPEYLEKIVQFAIHLPVVSFEDLKAFVAKGLGALVDKNPFDWERWHELWDHGGKRFLDTPRKIRRILQTYRFQLSVFAGKNEPEVDLVDLFGVEILRLYASDLWNRLPDLGEMLFEFSVGDYFPQKNGEPSAVEQAITELIELVPVDLRDAAKDLLGQLLPSSERSRREAAELDALRTCRLGTAIHFPSYFVLATNAAYPTQQEISAFCASLDQPTASESSLRELVKRYTYRRTLVKLQSRFETLTDLPKIINLLSALWRAAEEDAATFEREIDIPIDFAIQSYTTALLERIADPNARHAVLETALAQSKALYPFVHYLNHGRAVIREQGSEAWHVLPVGEKTLDEMSSKALEALKQLIANERLLYQPNLLHLLFFWIRMEGEEPARTWVQSVAAADEGLAIFTPHLCGSSTTGGDGFGRLRRSVTTYSILVPILERFFVLDQAFKQRVEKIDHKALTEVQAHAMDEILRNIQEKERAAEAAAKKLTPPATPDTPSPSA
jgi:predicted KAP-like P-loop ATPase